MIEKYNVLKSNEIIQKTRYSLSLQEQKIILYLISKIKPDDIVFKDYEFSLKELCLIMAISPNGKNYLNFKKSIKNLADKSFWIEKNSKQILCRWINRVELDSSTVKIQLNEDLKPYLIKLHEFFTIYSLDYILPMQSRYSIRFYELLKSFANHKEMLFDITDLKLKLNITGYNNYKEFRRNIIDLTVNEINKLTDLYVSYQPIRKGRSIKYLKFNIEIKKEL